MRNRKLYIYLTVYLLLGTAAVMSVQGQSPSREPPNERETLDVVVPRGKPKAISDWALAGVVWSDACLLRKLALESAESSDDKTVQDRYATLADEADKLISSLEEFGWRRIAARSSEGTDRPPADSDREQANRPETSDDMPQRQSGQRARDDDGALITPSDAPVDLDPEQRNFRLEGAGDVGPERLPPQVEKGLEEAIARRGLRSAEFSERTGRISYRESQTQSDTMPFSDDSIYDTGDYDPDVDYRAENPLVAETDSVVDIERLSPEETDAPEETEDSDDNEPEFDGGEVNPSELLDRLSGSTSVKQFTADSGRYQEDADWVQMHLDMNQMLWTRVKGGPQVVPATQLAQLKLANSAAMTHASTENSRLREILSVVTD